MRTPLLLAVLLTLSPASRAGQEELRGRVERTIAEWRAHPGLSQERLIQGLLALGPEVGPVLAELVDPPAETLPLVPIARTLARAGGDPGRLALTRLASSETMTHRETAIAALGEMREPAALEPLLVLLGDAHPRVQLAAAQAVADLVAADVLAPPVDALAVHLRESQERDGYAFALARLESEEARETLHRLAEDAFDPTIALAALAGLWESPRESDGPLVVDLVRDADFLAVRKQACLLAGRLAYRPAVRALIDVLHEDDAGLVKNAHWALVKITAQTLAPDATLWEAWWERSGEAARE